MRSPKTYTSTNVVCNMIHGDQHVLSSQAAELECYCLIKGLANATDWIVTWHLVGVLVTHSYNFRLKVQILERPLQSCNLPNR